MTSSSIPRTSTFSRLRRRNLLEVAAFLLLFMLIPALLWSQDGVIRAYFFFSAECEECKEVKEELLPSLKKEHGQALAVREYDLAVPENYDLLVRFEEKHEKRGSEPPIIVIGDSLLGGFDEVLGSLPGTVAEIAAGGGCPWPSVEERKESSQKFKGVQIAAFYQFGCKTCARIELLLNNIAKRYPRAVVGRYDSKSSYNRFLLESTSEIAGIPEDKRLITPVIFVGEKYLIGKAISDGAVVELMGEADAGADIVSEARATEGRAPERISKRVESFKALAVISAGLIDGINPCAFATIVFFISYLVLVGRSRKEILIVGAFFTLAVFLSYIAIGLGLFGGIRTLKYFPAVAVVFSYGIAAFAFVLGALSFIDYLKCKRGKASEMILQLPIAAKKRIHAVIREHARLRNFVIASLAIGFLVSLIELVCTGQIYLPTITLMVSKGAFNLRAFFLLILYNLAFILPLIGIIILVSVGLSAERLGSFMMKHLVTIKLLSTILFFALAALIFLI